MKKLCLKLSLPEQEHGRPFLAIRDTCPAILQVALRGPEERRN
jgi:hypothetical protein